MGDSDDYVLWAGNLHRDTTEEILYELFLQSGPLTSVKKPKEKNFAFINFKHKESVKFAMKIFQGICLFGQMVNLKHREAKSANNTPRNENKSGRLDSGRKRSRSRSPPKQSPNNRGPRRDNNWDNTPRRDNGRRVFVGDDPYQQPRSNNQWPGEDGYYDQGYNQGYDNYQSNGNPYKPAYTPDRNQGRQRNRYVDDHQRSYSAPQNRYAGSRNRNGAYR